MNKLNILIIALLIMASMGMGLASAETETYKLNDVVDLKFRCTLDGGIPSDSAKLNITISYPNGSTYIKSNETSLIGQGLFNYTTNFSTLGTHRVDIFCTDGTYSYSNNGIYEITPSGFADTKYLYIIALSILAGITVLGFSIKESWFVILAGMGFIILGVYSLNSGVVGFQDKFVTLAIALFEIGVGTILSVGSAIQKMDLD